MCFRFFAANMAFHAALLVGMAMVIGPLIFHLQYIAALLLAPLWITLRTPVAISRYQGYFGLVRDWSAGTIGLLVYFCLFAFLKKRYLDFTEKSLFYKPFPSSSQELLLGICRYLLEYLPWIGSVSTMYLINSLMFSRLSGTLWAVLPKWNFEQFCIANLRSCWVLQENSGSFRAAWRPANIALVDNGSWGMIRAF